MKTILAGALVLLLVGLGCNGENTTLTPGSADDPGYQLFMQEFGSIDDGTGVMVQSTFDMVDGVFNSSPGSPPAAPGAYQISLEYDTQTNEWVGTFEFTDSETGANLAFENRVQFIQGGDPVQYPDENLVEQVKSNVHVTVSSQEIDATGFQAMTIGVDHQVEDVLLTLNGTGGWGMTLSHTGTAGTCDVSMDFTSRVNNVQLWASQTGSEGSCPIAGSLSYSGTGDIQCTGGQNGDASVSGTWSVSRTFSPAGTTTTRVIHDGNVWTVTGPC